MNSENLHVQAGLLKCCNSYVDKWRELGVEMYQERVVNTPPPIGYGIKRTVLHT